MADSKSSAFFLECEALAHKVGSSRSVEIFAFAFSRKSFAQIYENKENMLDIYESPFSSARPSQLTHKAGSSRRGLKRDVVYLC
jgi:hypothetical protein